MGYTMTTYQWQKNGANITDETSSTLVLTALTESDSGVYRVVATNTDSGRSKASRTKAITIAVVLALFESGLESSISGLGSTIATTLTS